MNAATSAALIGRDLVQSSSPGASGKYFATSSSMLRISTTSLARDPTPYNSPALSGKNSKNHIAMDVVSGVRDCTWCHQKGGMYSASPGSNSTTVPRAPRQRGNLE